eukprot:jgi/Bigna1/88799/estExt_fgenesh1_pg.C_380096
MGAYGLQYNLIEKAKLLPLRLLPAFPLLALTACSAPSSSSLSRFHARLSSRIAASSKCFQLQHHQQQHHHPLRRRFPRELLSGISSFTKQRSMPRNIYVVEAAAGEESSSFDSPIDDLEIGSELEIPSENDAQTEDSGDHEEDDDGYESVVAPGVSILYPWGNQAYEVANKMLKDNPSLKDIAIYSFKTRNRARLEVSLDKLTDPRGSPTLDEVALFAREFRFYLEEAMGEKADNIEIEVSTAGAEREIRLPDELERFASFPMRVSFRNGSTNGGDRNEQLIMDFKNLDRDIDVTEWRLADVKANRWVDKRGKIMPLRRADKDRVIKIALDDLKQVSMHLDV